MEPISVVGAAFAALYAAHMVGDHWVQTDHEAAHKGLKGWTGRLNCFMHVLSMTVTKAVALLALSLVTGWSPGWFQLITALGVDAVSHYWADRRTTLAALAELIPGKANFYRLGSPPVNPGTDLSHIG